MELSAEAKYIVAAEFRKAVKLKQELWSCLALIGSHLPSITESELEDAVDLLVAADSNVAQMSDYQILLEIESCAVGDAADEEDADAE